MGNNMKTKNTKEKRTGKSLTKNLEVHANLKSGTPLAVETQKMPTICISTGIEKFITELNGCVKGSNINPLEIKKMWTETLPFRAQKSMSGNRQKSVKRFLYGTPAGSLIPCRNDAHFPTFLSVSVNYGNARIRPDNIPCIIGTELLVQKNEPVSRGLPPGL